METTTQNSKSVFQYDLQGNFIKEFNSIADCRRFMLEEYSIKFGDGEISNVCSGKRNHAHEKRKYQSCKKCTLPR